jgi:hypothetical protein
MLDRPIFNLSNGTFYDLWRRTCLVSGLREDPRFYTMRVGAGGRLDGKHHARREISLLTLETS